MNSQWTAHLPKEEDKEDFISVVQNSTYVLGRLHDIYEQKLDSLNREKIQDGFENPNWALRQAYLLGQIKTLVELQKLTQFAKDKYNDG